MFKCNYTFCNQCLNSVDNGKFCILDHNCIQGSEFISKDEEYEILHLGLDNNIPEGCKNCSNHPNNGGSGICHCTIPYLNNPII